MAKNTENRSVGDNPAVEMLPGVFRSTLCYNEETMLCHFKMTKGAKIALHNHAAAQNGYIVSGRVRFFHEDGRSFVATAGTGYLFDSNEKHGSEALEESELIECFNPLRPEYADHEEAKRR